MQEASVLSAWTETTSGCAGVLLSNVLRGATLSGDPQSWQFEVLWFLHFLTIPLLLTLMLVLLVVAPTHEAYASMKVRLCVCVCVCVCLCVRVCAQQLRLAAAA